MGLLTGISFLSVFEILFWLLKLPQKHNNQDVPPTFVHNTKVPMPDVEDGRSCTVFDIE